MEEMNVDPELDNYVEFQGISESFERKIFDHMFSVKCSEPLDIVSNSNFIKFCDFRLMQVVYAGDTICGAGVKYVP